MCIWRGTKLHAQQSEIKFQHEKNTTCKLMMYFEQSPKHDWLPAVVIFLHSQMNRNLADASKLQVYPPLANYTHKNFTPNAIIFQMTCGQSPCHSPALSRDVGEERDRPAWWCVSPGTEEVGICRWSHYLPDDGSYKIKIRVNNRDSWETAGHFFDFHFNL